MDGLTYLKKLQEAYYERGGKEVWDTLMSKAHGISPDDRAELIAEYPDIPASLLQILDRIDGTYYRTYGDEEFCTYFFGSDVEDGTYPYYLHAYNDIMEDRERVQDFDDVFKAHLQYPDDDMLYVTDKVLCEPEKMKWLCFSHCMNNGGTSSLYVDFTPSEKGTAGQIVRFLHDPDNVEVIADSFDAFLDMIVENGLGFVSSENFE